MTIHWMRKTRFFKIWQVMNKRVKWQSKYDIKHYSHLTICNEWKSFLKFKDDMYIDYLFHVLNFWEIDTSIDRIDNTKWYYKENCRWVTKWEQMRNTSKTIHFTYNWKTQCLKDWCIELWKDYKRTHQRYKKLWRSIERSLELNI